MENTYLVKSFKIFPKHEQTLFYTPEISALIKHPNLGILLEIIQQYQEQQIDDGWLEKQIEKCDLDCIMVKDYLLYDIKVIAPLDPLRFTKIVISTDRKDIELKLKQYFSRNQSVSILENTALDKVDQQTLILCFNHVYSADVIYFLHDVIEQHKAWLLSAYVANHYLVIDNIYHHDKGMPCHFCQFNRQEHVALSTNVIKKTSWVNFSRRLLREEVSFYPAMNLSEVEEAACFFWLAHALKKFVDPHEVTQFIHDVGNYQWINLKTGEMQQDAAVHWAMCECLGR